ncbi:hypothetical protein EfmJHP10_17130 [Enterococcus faecium]|nr:hypothetical protein EfmJHP10_17130 [Enterococcus faecium]
MTKGLVRLERYDESATYYYYDYVNTNNLFPMSGMFGEETYTYTAQAMTDIETFYLPVVVFYTQIIRFKTNYSIPLYIFYIITNYICKVLKLVSNVGMLKLLKQNLFILKEDSEQ